LGLAKLQEAEGVQLSSGILAICALAERRLTLLDTELQDGIRRFVRDLFRETGEARSAR